MNRKVKLALRHAEHWQQAKNFGDQLTAEHHIDKAFKCFSIEEKREFLDNLGKDHNLYPRYA